MEHPVQTSEATSNNLGVFYWSSGKTGQAIACFKKAIELFPRYYDKANDNLARATHALEKNKKTNQDTSTVEPSVCPS